MRTINTIDEGREAIRNMPEWRKQKLGEVLLRFAQNHGLLDDATATAQPTEAASAKPEEVRQ